MIVHYSEPRLNPKRDRVIMKHIARSKGTHVVPKIIQNKPLNTACFEVNMGLAANPEQFVMALTKRVEKLTSNKQKTFFTNSLEWLEKQSPEYINRLKGYATELITDKEKSKELVVFNQFKRNFFALGSKNGVDLKRFFIG